MLCIIVAGFFFVAFKVVVRFKKTKKKKRVCLEGGWPGIKDSAGNSR